MWLIFVNFLWIFHDNSKNKKNYFSFVSAHCTMRIFHKNRIKTEGGGLHTLSWEKSRKYDQYQKQFHFSTLYLNSKFYWNRFTGWKVENLGYIPSHFHRANIRKGFIQVGPAYKTGNWLRLSKRRSHGMITDALHLLQALRYFYIHTIKISINAYLHLK